MRSLTPRSFKQIRLALFFPPASGATGAAGPCRLAFANDNARLRLCPDFPNRVLRLAGRLALAQLRSVVSPCRAVLSPALSDAAFMVQAGPCRVVVSVRAALLPVVRHQRPPAAVANDLTASGEAVVPQVMGGSRDHAGL